MKNEEGMWVRVTRKVKIVRKKSPKSRSISFETKKTKVEEQLKQENAVQLPSETKLIVEAITTLGKARGSSYSDIEEYVSTTSGFKIKFESLSRLIKRKEVVQTQGENSFKTYKLGKTSVKPIREPEMILAAVTATHKPTTKETIKRYIVDKYRVDWTQFGKNFNHNLTVLLNARKLIASTSGYVLNTKFYGNNREATTVDEKKQVDEKEVEEEEELLDVF